jgi:TPR repeat protein
VKPFWKIAVFVGCVILIFGAAIAWHLVKARGDQRKLADDASACRVRAEQGDAEAQLKLARMYYYGKGVPQDYTEAANWCRKAADQGYAKAQYGLGYSYSQGKGEPQDQVEAFRWYRKAADQGYAKAQYALGFMYYRGMGVSQDDAQAVGWYRKAADQGEAMAQEALGFMYYKGTGVPQDYAEAVRWYRKAADQDYARAQYDLGSMYYRGQGVAQDRAEADRLFHEAARRGDEDARRFLGSRARHIATGKKITISITFLGSLSLLIGSLKSGQSLRNRPQRIAALTGLLGLSYAGFDLYWYLYLSRPQSWSADSALYFAKHLLAGVSLAMLLSIVFPRGAKAVLAISATLFIAFNLFAVAHYNLRHLAPAICVFCSANGLSIGISIPSVVFVWLERERNKRSHDGTGDVAISGTTR